jgi:hypothetical protein
MNAAAPTHRSQRWLVPALGLAVWLPFVAAVQPGWSASFVLFAPLVLFPLAFQLDDARWPLALRLFAATAAVLLLPAFLFEQGVRSALCTLPWAIFAVTLALRDAYWLAREDRWFALVARLYLLVGVGWLVLARFGARPLDYSHVIVQATAVHFHYAGFLLPLVIEQVVRRLPTRWMKGLGWGVVLGVPVVAAGITLSAFGIREPELAAAWLFALVCAPFAVGHALSGLRTPTNLSRGLIVLSSVALMTAMGFAVTYATGVYLDTPWLDIPAMLRWHGSLQALGFLLPALVGWNLARPSLEVPS